MADYSAFPFDIYSLAEVAQVFIGSVKIGDVEFARACREEIQRRRPVPAKEREKVVRVRVGYTFHAGDLLHKGHLWQLEQCRKHCDYLIVGVLTDRAITSYKREPVIPYPWRAAIYEALILVDEVVAQDDRDPTDNLKIYRPDVLFHGDDWPDVPGSAWMESQGLEVVRTKYFHGITTTSIIEEILRRAAK